MATEAAVKCVYTNASTISNNGLVSTALLEKQQVTYFLVILLSYENFFVACLFCSFPNKNQTSDGLLRVSCANNYLSR